MNKMHPSPVAGCICTYIFTHYKSDTENYDLTFNITCSSRELCSVLRHNVFKCHKGTK